MNRIRLLGLTIILVICMSILWVILHFQNDEISREDQMDRRLGDNRESPAIQPRSQIGKPREKSYDRALSIARKEVLLNLKKQLESLEIDRTFDRSHSTRDPSLAILVKARFNLENSQSQVRIEVEQVALDAPTSSQAESIRNLIRSHLPERLFVDIQQKESTIDALEKKYLNYKNKVKLIEYNVLVVEDTGEKHEWISEFDTTEIMQTVKPGGVLLSPKSFDGGTGSSFNTIQEAELRYGYLFDVRGN